MRNQTYSLKRAFGTNNDALAIFRMVLGVLLLFELLLRFRFLHAFYSDEGTLPTRLLLPKIDLLYRIICIHAYNGSLIYMQVLLGIQSILAFCLMLGYKTKISSVASWFLYLSLTLRNTWLNFILDRYFHYLLFWAMFLPLDKKWSIDRLHNRKEKQEQSDDVHDEGNDYGTFVSLATIGLKAQIFWIYLDAGAGKYNDPLGGWTFNADPLPALDTYARHTLVARYMYSLLGPFGLRLMTPTVVYVELFAAPVALIGSFVGNRRIVLSAIGIICSLHMGIALTVRNTFLLSSVACCAWCIYLPPKDIDGKQTTNKIRSKTCEEDKTKYQTSILSSIIIISMVCGSVWFETMSEECNQSMKHIWSTLLHNRWNVFVGAEEYVTWEIAPGRLVDGSVVDIWGKVDEVSWSMPVSGAPCTSTSRPGRWRSFPYLAGLDDEDGQALWDYLCFDWDRMNRVNDGNSNRKLLRFNFFMLQADVLPEMGFSATRKRLIHSHVCGTKESSDDKNDNKQYQHDGKRSEHEL